MASTAYSPRATIKAMPMTQVTSTAYRPCNRTTVIDYSVYQDNKQELYASAQRHDHNITDSDTLSTRTGQARMGIHQQYKS